MDGALRAATGYLLRAQAANKDGGMGSYHLTEGWGASYPETTGYAIPSLLAVAEYLSWGAPAESAHRAGEWLLGIQRQDGGWQGGRIGEDRKSTVFNTAQVIRGMLALHARSGEPRFLESALRAGRWIVSVQDADGAWRAANFLGLARVYDTYVDAPLMHLSKIGGDPVFRQAAERNLRWVRTQMHPNGWFSNADNTVRRNARPITHTIAYTLDGLLECGQLSGQAEWSGCARPAAALLADRFLAEGKLNGRYDVAWAGSEHAIMTGCAQLCIVWARIGDARMIEARERMLARLLDIQGRSVRGAAAVEGALPGSFPLWGRYERFAFPNWGTKYLIDALLHKLGHPPAF